MRILVWYRLWRRKLALLIKTNQELARKAHLANVERVYWTMPALVLGALIVAVFCSRINPLDSAEDLIWRGQIVLVYSGITLASTFAWLVARRLKKGDFNEKFAAVFLHFVFLAILVSGVVLAAVNQKFLSNVGPMLVCSTVVGSLYYIRPSHAALLFSVTLFLFRYNLFHDTLQRWADFSTSALSASLIGAFVITIHGFLLSTLTWHSFRVNTLQKEKIAQQQSVLEQMAYTDPLTGLPNRRLLDELIKREISNVDRGEYDSSLVLFDLDDFKAVNDNLGHPAGDRVLKQLASLLQETIRGDNTLVRLGGEEFIILLKETPLKDAVRLAKRLQKQLEKHEFFINGQIVRLTASFGVAPLLGIEKKENYYALADRALYKAKEQGKNCIEVVTGRDVAI